MSKTLTTQNFDNEISTGKVLVDFWASWCGPCRMLSITFDEVMGELEKRNITLGKVNVDEEMHLADRFNIQVIPALLLFIDGKLVKRKEGYMGPQELLTFINGN